MAGECVIERTRSGYATLDRAEPRTETAWPLHRSWKSRFERRGPNRRASVLSCLPDYLSFFGRVEVVQPQLAGGFLVELAVQLAAVRAPVVLAHETLVPDRVAHDAGLLDQDLLFQAVDHLLPAADLDLVVEHDQAVRVGLAPDHRHLSSSFIFGVDDRPRLGRLPPRAANKAQLGPEPLGRFALSLVVLCLRLLERAPHAQQVVAKAVIGRKQLWLLFRRADQLLEGMFERGLNSLLAVRDVRLPRLVFGEPHALVEHDLEVEPVIAELRDEHALDQVGQAMLFQQRRSHLPARVGPTLPAHDVVNPVVEDRDRVLEGCRRGPDAGRPGPLARPDLVVEGDNLLFV